MVSNTFLCARPKNLVLHTKKNTINGVFIASLLMNNILFSFKFPTAELRDYEIIRIFFKFVIDF